MSTVVRLLLYIVLILSCLYFGNRFVQDYGEVQEARERAREEAARELTGEEDPGSGEADGEEAGEEEASDPPRLGFSGGGFLLSLALLGILAARDFSHFMGTLSHSLMTSGEGAAPGEDIYEEAETEWGKGNYLEAIGILREYLKKNPRQQHAALRIAEIYEKDLGNPLAAALEYEEILTRKLPRERWGWAAIHLANLYSGPLDKPEEAMKLLRRLAGEYGDTQAAAKARERLDRVEGSPEEA